MEELRAQIAAIERSHRSVQGSMPFGIDALDAHLPAGGLRRGALQEVAGGGPGTVHGAAAVLFVAGVLARMEGPVLWCLRQRDLFAPALAGVGLHPERVLYAEPGDEKGVLAFLEDGLRQGGLSAVVGEVGGLAMTASRRLQLAAEEGAHAHAAMADTAEAAWALARYGPGRAVVSTRGQAGPDLDPLPLAALRLQAETVEGLGNSAWKRSATWSARPGLPWRCALGRP